MRALLDMGGYGAFVWPAYGVTALAMGFAIIFAIRGYRRAKARLAQLEKS
jgi:heme exporter protein D